jgi:hypothetical protein
MTYFTKINFHLHCLQVLARAKDFSSRYIATFFNQSQILFSHLSWPSHNMQLSILLYASTYWCCNLIPLEMRIEANPDHHFIPKSFVENESVRSAASLVIVSSTTLACFTTLKWVCITELRTVATANSQCQETPPCKCKSCSFKTIKKAVSDKPPSRTPTSRTQISRI